MDERWSCARCGEPVGVYEPVVLDEPQGPRATSRAREPQAPAVDAFHEECWAERRREAGPAPR
jgi:hypothetical protein